MKELSTKMGEALKDYVSSVDYSKAEIKYSSERSAGYENRALLNEVKNKLKELSSEQIREVIALTEPKFKQFPYKYNIQAYQLLINLCKKELHIRAMNLSKTSGATI